MRISAPLTGVPPCFVCSAPGICEHRESELVPYWLSRHSQITPAEAENPRSGRAERLLEVPQGHRPGDARLKSLRKAKSGFSRMDVPVKVWKAREWV